MRVSTKWLHSQHTDVVKYVSNDKPRLGRSNIISAELLCLRHEEKPKNAAMRFVHESLNRDLAQIRLFRFERQEAPSKQEQDNSPQKLDSSPQKQGSSWSRLRSSESGLQKAPKDQRRDTSPPLRGTIRIVDLDSAPTFHALSYTWGTDIASHELELDGGTFFMRGNLWSFLNVACCEVHLHDQWLWIDQLCIDQSSTAERNHQVSMMNRIYGSASSVIVWLGPGTPESDAGMEYLATHDWGDALSEYDQYGTWDRTDPSQDEMGTLDFDNLLLKDDSVSNVSKGLSEIFRRPYWGRMWIVQEFLLATELRVYCGGKSFLWPQRMTFRVRESPTYHGEIARISRMCSSAEELVRTYAARSNAFSWSLGEWIAKFLHQGCSDQRDMVYGLFGLAKDRNGISVDYNLSLVEILYQVLQHERDSAEAIITSIFKGVKREGQEVCDYDMDIGLSLKALTAGYIPGPKMESGLKSSDESLARLFRKVDESMRRNPEWPEVKHKLRRFERGTNNDLADYEWYFERHTDTFWTRYHAIAARPDRVTASESWST